MTRKHPFSFGANARKTAEFYVSLFDDAELTRIHRGEEDVVEFQVLGQEFEASTSRGVVVPLAAAALDAEAKRRGPLGPRPRRPRPLRSSRLAPRR